LDVKGVKYFTEGEGAAEGGGGGGCDEPNGSDDVDEKEEEEEEDKEENEGPGEDETSDNVDVDTLRPVSDDNDNNGVRDVGSGAGGGETDIYEGGNSFTKELTSLFDILLSIISCESLVGFISISIPLFTESPEDEFPMLLFSSLSPNPEFGFILIASSSITCPYFNSSNLLLYFGMNEFSSILDQSNGVHIPLSQNRSEIVREEGGVEEYEVVVVVAVDDDDDDDDGDDDDPGGKELGTGGVKGAATELGAGGVEGAVTELGINKVVGVDNGDDDEFTEFFKILHEGRSLCKASEEEILIPLCSSNCVIKSIAILRCIRVEARL
jgi:hypothetical protein